MSDQSKQTQPLSHSLDEINVDTDPVAALQACVQLWDVMSTQTIELTGKELGDFPETAEGKKDLREAARQAFLQLRDQWVACPALVSVEQTDQVQIRNRGIREFFAFSGNPKKMKMVAAIQHILRTATLESHTLQPNSKKDKKPDVLGYYRLKNKVRFQETGEVLNIIVLIEKDLKGLLHYDLVVPKDEHDQFDDLNIKKVGTTCHNTNSWDRTDQSNIGFDAINVNDSGMVINLFIEGEDQDSLSDPVDPVTSQPAMNPAISQASETLEVQALQNSLPQDAVIIPTGRTNPVKTAKGTKLSTQFAVVEADQLIASHDANGKENPNFPQELQPRDRARETSQTWVQKVAANLDPDSLGRTSRADSGAPIVGPDAVVESGNGRTMAIQLAYQRGTANEYRAWLIDEADYFGLDAEQINAMQSPVLVRIRTSAIDRKVFVVEANQDDKLTFTATEQARSDAKRLDDQLLGLFAPSDDGDLLTIANQRFIQGFLKSLGETEAAQYVTKDGKPSKGLVDRIKAAVFSKAYNDDRLLEMMADQTKPEIQNVLNALGAAAPRFIEAQAYGRIATESISEQIVDGIEQSLNQRVVDAVVNATNTLLAAKATGQDIREYVKQQGLFTDIDEGVAALAIFLATNGRSAKRMAIAFKAMAGFVKNDALAQQNNGLFGEPQAPTMIDVVAAANRELEKHYGDEDGNTIGLFDGLTSEMVAGLQQQLGAIDASNDPIGALSVCLQIWDAVQALSPSDLSDNYRDDNYRYKDVGYIAGSRKELAQSAILQAKRDGQLVQSTDIDWDALESDARIAEDSITKANVFGKPDWESLREGGMQGSAAYLIKRMYAAVATQPDHSSSDDRKRYVIAIQNLRSAFEACQTLPDVVTAMISHAKLLNLSGNMITLPDGSRDLNYDAKVAHTLGKKFRSWIFNSGNKAIHDARKLSRQNGADDWSWLAPTDRNPTDHKPKKPRFQLEAAADIERIGGETVSIVSTEQFKDRFGLKAVQSGNWVLKDKASIEFHVQRAAESLIDMADVTGIPAELLGFGGRLGLSFGARGKGGALAHYEPVQRVINITKMKGGGSLGHEYFHALDNIIRDLMQQKNDGEAGYFATERPDDLPDGEVKHAFQALQKAMLVAPIGITTITLDERLRSDLKSTRPSSKLLDSMRAANVQTATDIINILAATSYSGVQKNKPLSPFAITTILACMRAMNIITGDEATVIVPALWEVSAFRQRAISLDDGKVDKYWSKPLEMAARAYSAYLQDRLAEQGRQNDYLAYSTQGGNSRVGEVAYPQGEERKAINAAFDQLFHAIKSEQVFEKAMQNEALMDGLFGEEMERVIEDEECYAFL